MTMRTDSTEAMVAQLIRLVSDLQVVVKEQGELLKSQQLTLEEVAKLASQNSSQAWRQAAMLTSTGFRQ